MTSAFHHSRCVATALALLTPLACQGSHDASAGTFELSGRHSSAMAISADGRLLFAVNPDADSVSVIDLTKRSLRREILLASAHPALDSSSGNYTPAVMPRALALSPRGDTLYVTGERSGTLYQIDVASGTVEQSVAVGSEPIGVLVSSDGASAFVVCSQDSTVVRVDIASAQVAAAANVPNEPWALAWAADDSLLVTAFMGPGVTVIDPNTMAVGDTWTIPDTAPRAEKRLAHGQVRGLYDAALRPNTGELWVAHALLGTDTAQPELDFESTAFPALSLLGVSGTYEQTLSSDAQDVPGINGSFGDVVSGPQALSFTSDGDYLLLVDANSEDVMVIDAERRVESSLVRPLPGDLPDAIVMSTDGKFAYVNERASNDVAVLRLDRSTGPLTATVDGAPIAKLSTDPMPANLRLGQELFNSANSSEHPLTTDHWIACATCHMEGRSDAVTWKFVQGPRDTPTNAGGVLGTGFLFRTADRTKVQDYWHTINTEQGGRFDPTAQAPLLDALTAYVNFALPAPIPPTTDSELVTRGSRVFQSSGCATCHSGPRFTDSGEGNPTLDLSGPILLHDVGTCVTSGSFPDVAHEDVAGNPRAACAFDTPSLTGIASSPPYLHDGSAATLRDSIQKMPTPPSSADDMNALQEYLRSL
jgi:YVTN family beta-propeller protein